MKTLHTIYTNFAKRVLMAIALITMGVSTAWGAGIATLPVDYDFSGGKYNLPVGVTCTGLDDDYAAQNSPYLLKFDGTNDHLQIQVNGAVGKIIFEVKMLGGANTSYFQLQGSSNGDSFNDIEKFTISGAQNDVITCTTSENIDDSYRYFKFVFTKGSNVGFGKLQLLEVGNNNCEATYNFVNNLNFNTWDTDYEERVLNYTDAKVIFESADKQQSSATIADRPVTKGQPVSLVMTDGSTLSAVEWVCKQWETKTQTITLYYSTDGGESYTSTGITSSDFNISSNNLPVGTNAVKITFSSSKNQVGITSCTIEKVCGPTETTITLNPNGGTGDVITETTEETTYEVPSCSFTRIGYNFSEWNTEENGTGNSYNPEDEITLNGTEVNLYAQWTAQQYNIIYKDQGDVAFSGTHEDDYPTQHTYGIETTLKGATKIGYTFEEWYTDAACTNKVTTLGATEYTSAITLYAKWTANTYSVQFDANGGIGSMDNQSFTYDASPKALSANIFERVGYNFTGWNTAADGNGTSYADKAEVQNLTATANGVVTLHAQWTAKNLINFRTLCTYNIEYTNLEGATHSNPETYTAANLPLEFTAPSAREGYTFDGWDPATLSAETRGDQEVEAQWTVNQYTVTWKLNGGQWQGGGTEDRVNNHNYGADVTKPVDPSRTGYTFTGWYPAEIPATMPAENLEFTAQWTPTPYTVTWKLGGIEYATSTVSIENSLSTAPDNPSDGELGCCADKFMGWSSQQSPSAGDIFTKDNIPSNVTTAKTYYAVFATAAQGVGTSIADFSEMGYENGTAVTEPIVLGDGEGHGDATITLAKAPSSKNDAKYYDDGAAVRVYAGGTITISSTYGGATIKSVTFEFSASDPEGDNTISVTSGDGTYSEGIWTGDASTVTFTIGGSTGHRRIASITVTTGVAGSQYTNYVTSCDKMNDPSLGAVQLTYKSGDAIAVNCGTLSSKNSAASITFPNAVNLTCPITVTAPAGFVLATNRQSDTYTQTVVIKPVKTAGENKGKITKTVYVRADAPENSETDYSSNITITGEEITETTVTVKADVTCKTYTFETLTHIGDEHTSNTYYAGQTIEEAPVEPDKDDCSENYTFDGWSTAPVEYGSVAYSKVTFPYTMPAENVTLIPVYRLLEDISKADYHRVTSDLGDDNWAGDYLIAANNDEYFAMGLKGGTSDIECIGGENSAVTTMKQYVVNNTISYSYGDPIHVTMIAVENGYVLQTRDGRYNFIRNTETSGLVDASGKNTAAEYPLTISFDKESHNVSIANLQTTNKAELRYTGSRFGFYDPTKYNPIYLYKKSPLYTTSLICGTIDIQESDIVVTSTKDQSVKVSVPVKLTSPYNDAVAISGANVNSFSVITKENVPVNTEEVVNVELVYSPQAYDQLETETITLTATNGATTSFQITGRSLPEKFAIVAEKDGKYYALPADMPSAGTYAGYEVEVKDNAIVTAPATYVYSLSAVHNTRYADNGTAVRFVGNDNKCLWASVSKDAPTSIRNFAGIENAQSDQYEWNLSTTDGERYTISSSAVADAERILRLYNQKFGMYTNGVSEFYFLPLMASTEDAKVLSSAFSVSATEKVQFSAGNLQYHTGDKAWRFAPEQYDYVGDDNANIGEPTFEGWIDMFGWSADGKYGVNTSINNDDYQGEFVDWGTLFPDEWYTLSMNEWYYLLNTRTNAANLKQLAKVGDVYGVLLFPDEWVMPYDVATPSHDEYNRYSYSLEDWQKLEIAGAVFLPAAGRRAENHQYNTNEYIYYWTSTKETQDKVYYLISCNALGNDQYEYALPQLWYEKGLYGQSVRLVRKLMPLQVVEWKENSVVVMYNGDPAQTATVTINNEQKGTATLSDVRKDEAVYELPATGLASSPNQPLEIAIGNAKALMTIPYVATTTTTNVVPNNSDLVVLKDATFTATNEQLRNVTVYGGGKLVVGEGATLSTNSLTLRAGGVTADGNYDYVYPQFVLNGTWSNTSDKINLDYLTTKEQYYTFVAPFAVNTKDIKYPVDIYGNNVAVANKGSFEFQYYDGAARAEGKTGWTVVPEGDDGANLEAGQGYTFLGMPKKVSVNGGSSTRQTFGIHRIPMTVAAGTAMTHETTDQTAPLSVHLCDKNNNSGWNLIGNPYMTTITGLTNNDIQVGKLVHTTDANGNWTGGWHWDTSTETTNQRFLVIPSNDGQSYEAVQASNATLPAFKNFFVQISNEGANALIIPRTTPAAQLLAPACRTEEVVKDVEVAIVLEQDEAHTDQMDFLINNIYTEDFERDADFTKMMNATNLNLYGVHPYDNLSFVAIDNNTARGSVAIGYQVPQAGEYILRMSDKPYVLFDKIEALYVTDHEMSPEVTTDIMSEPYRFTVDNAETNHTRFTVSVILKMEEDDGGGDVGTGVDNTTNNNTPCKFIYQDKMYILRNGVIYDAMGKQVQTINK